MFGGGRPHPEDKLGPEVPEDVVEEGDGQEEDGEKPSLANYELKTVHLLLTKLANILQKS